MTNEDPPRRAMPAWKEASVRSEGLKNRRPSTLPASACGSGRCSSRRARSSSARISSRSKSARSTKRLRLMAAQRPAKAKLRARTENAGPRTPAEKAWLRAPAELWAGGPSCGQARERIAQQIDVRLLENKRREDAQHVRIGARAGENAARQQLGLHGLRGPRGEKSQQKARALKASHRAGEARLAEVRGHAPDAREQILRFDGVYHRLDGCAGEAAAERRAEEVELDSRGDLRRHEERRARKAVAERLRRRDHVGRHAVEARGERMTRAAHAALHLVEDQQRADLITAAPQLFKERLPQIERAAETLNRLDDDCRRLLRHVLRDRRGIAPR